MPGWQGAGRSRKLVAIAYAVAKKNLCGISNPDQVHLPLPVPDEPDPEDELFPFYEYLINHEFRIVNFVADTEAQSSYRIISSYLASLGSDYGHGQSGTVH